jgi:serine/threonine-protein kinase
VVTRFLQEAQILKRLDEPHLVRVHDLVVEGSRLGIVMDLVDGPDLRSELARRGTFRPVEAATIIDSVLAGLAAVHAGGIVHRDIKPENVLLGGGEPSGARLTDFGIARIAEESQKARRTTVVGTPEYLAPEVADGAEPTPGSDLYGVGIMLYELVTGVTPFAGGSPLAVLRRHAEQQPVRPEGMPDGIWEAVSALLVKNPADRPRDAAFVRQRLAALVPGFAAAPALRPLTEPPTATVTAQHTVLGLRSQTEVIPTVPEPTRSPEPRTRRTGLLVGVLALLVVLLAGGITAFVVTRSDDAATADAQGPTETTAPDRSTSERSTAGRTSASESDTAGEVPAVVGLQLSSARRELTNAGLEVEIREVLDDTQADNTVTDQDPAPGSVAEAGDVVTLTVARKSVSVFLADLEPVDQGYFGSGTGTMNLNGKTYVHAVYTDTGCSQAAALQYDLGRHYQVFDATVGLSDDSASEGALQIDVLLDGRSVFSGQASLGQPQQVQVDVTGGLRLEISAARVEPDCDDWNDVTTVWGDARLQGQPGEVPSPTATPTS